MYITEEYREQNRLLHEMDPGYGSYSHKWADHVVEIMTREGCSTVLDYGCGKGALARALDGMGVIEYDPAIPGKGIAVPADLVVCTDVLEHIEPALLTHVIAHLWDCTTRRLFFCISTRAARNHLPDGRNTHQLVQSPDWWRAQLERKFALDRWHVGGDHVTGEGVPLKAIGRIHCTSAVEDDERNGNVRINCARTSRRLDVTGAPDNGRTAVLVCNGPSLADTWPAVSLARFRGDADVFSVSSAHRFLIDHGIIPMAHLDCDPREHKMRQIGAPHPQVKYWLASCVHPGWLDLLAGHDVSLWHSYNGQASRVAFDIDPDARMVVGGGSIGLRAISVLYCLGYRRFEIHGMDCSFRDGSAYTGEHLGKRKEAVRVKCGDRWFESASVLILYARYFTKHCSLLPDAQFILHGDGLLQNMNKES
jgi:hypothetical protein